MIAAAFAVPLLVAPGPIRLPDGGQIVLHFARVLDSEGNRIPVAWWKPAGAGPFPAVLIVPSIGPAIPGIRRPQWQRLAADGMVVAALDPEGRCTLPDRRNTGVESWQGPNQQEDVKCVVEFLARLPYVARQNIGLVSFSGGSLLAGCALGRWPDMPVAYWVDVEGPHDGTIILGAPGGHPSPLKDPSPENIAFWNERSPVRFIARYRGRYMRVQAEIDHAQGKYVEHAIAMINAATSRKHGGSGQCTWTRLNGAECGNPVNAVYGHEGPKPRFLAGALRDYPNGKGPGACARYVREICMMVAQETGDLVGPRFVRHVGGAVFEPSADESWQGRDVLACDVAWDADKRRLRMWYTAYDGRRYAVGYAESSDGVRWKRLDQPVVQGGTGEWDAEGAAFPAVVRVGATWRMYYTGFKQARGHRHGAVFVAESEDGLHWKRLGDGPIVAPGASGTGLDREACVSCDVVRDSDGRWHMFYCGGTSWPGDADGRFHIMHAVSRDGLTWRVDPRPALAGAIAGYQDALHPEVVRAPDGKWWMLFVARSSHADFRMYVAQSSDLQTWRLLRRMPALIVGEPSFFDERGVSHPSAAWVGRDLLLLYTGYDRRPRRAIGLAVARGIASGR